MGYDINQTFIIESSAGDTPIVSACTSVYTNVIESCSGDTKIFLSNGVITFDGILYTNNNLSANSISASTFYSGGSNVFDVVTQIDITGGTFNSNTDSLTLFKKDDSIIVVTGFTDYYTTGATLIGNTVYFDRNDLLSAYTLNLGAISDKYVTGVTFSDNQIIIGRNDGVNLNTFINVFTGLTINGNLTADSISATTISATTFYGDGSNLTGISTQDTFVTGGTYNQSTGVATFTNNTGGTFTVFGFLTGYTDTVVTAFTYNNNTFNIVSSNGNSLTADINSMTGLTVNGSFSATTYLGLPIDIRVTGGTYNQSNNIATFTNNTGGTFTVSGFNSSFTGGTVTGATVFRGGLSANTISATTYQNLPVTADTFTTALTYSNNVVTIARNQGLSNLSATINTMTGLTVNGSTALNGTISSTNLSGATNRVVQVSSGGTFSATQQIISGYLSSGTTVAGYLENTSNWDINGEYIGPAITGTFQGQRYYNNNYFFEAVSDNFFIRLIWG